MANLTLFTANRFSGNTTYLAEFFGAQTATDFEIISSEGILREYFSGTDFTYRSGFFRTGTINEQYGFNADGSLASSITGLSLDVAERNAALTIGTSGARLGQLIFAGDDVIVGSEGDDAFGGSRGTDTIDGGAGSDVLSYDGFDSAVVADLVSGKAETELGTATMVRIEDLTGSEFADTLRGNSGRNLLQGLAGNDIIDGRGGIDTVSYLDATSAVTVDLTAGTATGGSGNDTLSGIERVIGSRHNDTLLGSAATDSFLGSFGDDAIDGRGGIDTVEYGNVARGVTVNLGAGTATGGAGTDTLTSIENATGSIFNDTLVGSGKANTLRGMAGNDTISGGAGADRLNGDAGRDILSGGTGNDTLTGGLGQDVFRFNTTLGTARIANIDRITDFSVTDDTIQLENAIFTRYGTATGEIAAGTFKSIATGDATDANDYIVYNKTTGALFYDTNGSTGGLADAVQIATLSKDLLLTSEDFVLI
jgi:serralysin